MVVPPYSIDEPQNLPYQIKEDSRQIYTRSLQREGKGEGEGSRGAFISNSICTNEPIGWQNNITVGLRERDSLVTLTHRISLYYILELGASIISIITR